MLTPPSTMCYLHDCSEESMTNALKRSCPKCASSFLKTEGCNKVFFFCSCIHFPKFILLTFALVFGVDCVADGCRTRR